MDQVIQVAPNCVRLGAELFDRQSQPIDPEGRVAEPLRSRRIPTGKRHVTNMLAGESEGVDCRLIGSGMRLKRSESVDTQDLLEDSFQLCVPDSSVENLRRCVREERQPETSPPKGLQGGTDI